MADSEGGGGSGIGTDALYFLGILVVIFAVWIGTGGPSRPISFAGPFLSPLTGTGTTSQAYGDPNSFSPLGSGTIPGKASTYRGTVSFVRDTSAARATNEDEEYVTITVSQNAAGPISTAGWKIVSTETGQGATFPQGAVVPRTGRVNDLSSIILSPGDQAIILTGDSPVGISFKENRCTGYLEEHQDFRPSLSQSCPTPSQEYDEFYDGSDDACESSIRSLSYCSTETKYLQNVSGSCRDFIEEYLTYNGCVAAHRNDSDFPVKTWRIFLEKNDDLWKKEGETILLVDASGNTIDALSY